MGHYIVKLSVLIWKYDPFQQIMGKSCDWQEYRPLEGDAPDELLE